MSHQPLMLGSTHKTPEPPCHRAGSGRGQRHETSNSSSPGLELVAGDMWGGRASEASRGLSVGGTEVGTRLRQTQAAEQAVKLQRGRCAAGQWEARSLHPGAEDGSHGIPPRAGLGDSNTASSAGKRPQTPAPGAPLGGSANCPSPGRQPRAAASSQLPLPDHEGRIRPQGRPVSCLSSPTTTRGEQPGAGG